MKKILLTGLGLCFLNFLFGQSQTDKLDKILGVLDKIKTASYYNIKSSSAPGDTLAFRTYERFENMYMNPADTFCGAGFSIAAIDNQNEFDLCYDGTYSVRFNWDNRSASVDTLNKNPDDRPTAPFFVKIKSLVMYAKKNIDNSVIRFQEFQDSIKISFYFYDKIVEFMKLTPSVSKSIGKVSRYELVVDKNYLPYTYIRRMPHQTSWEICKDIKFTEYYDYDFSAIRQIPVDFVIEGSKKEPLNTSELEGKMAVNWKLKEVFGDSISLIELKSKVLLIQFTGIGCGPCHASIPFLKKLVSDYEGQNLQLVSIETFSGNIAGIKRYKEHNGITWQFLVSTKELKDKYKIEGVPMFFILDQKRVIKKVIVGYKEGVTDKEIIQNINGLI